MLPFITRHYLSESVPRPFDLTNDVELSCTVGIILEAEHAAFDTPYHLIQRTTATSPFLRRLALPFVLTRVTAPPPTHTKLQQAADVTLLPPLDDETPLSLRDRASLMWALARRGLFVPLFGVVTPLEVALRIRHTLNTTEVSA